VSGLLEFVDLALREEVTCLARLDFLLRSRRPASLDGHFCLTASLTRPLCGRALIVGGALNCASPLFIPSPDRARCLTYSGYPRRWFVSLPRAPSPSRWPSATKRACSLGVALAEFLLFKLLSLSFPLGLHPPLSMAKGLTLHWDQSFGVACRSERVVPFPPLIRFDLGSPRDSPFEKKVPRGSPFFLAKWLPCHGSFWGEGVSSRELFFRGLPAI